MASPIVVYTLEKLAVGWFTANYDTFKPQRSVATIQGVGGHGSFFIPPFTLPFFLIQRSRVQIPRQIFSCLNNYEKPNEKKMSLLIDQLL